MKKVCSSTSIPGLWKAAQVLSKQRANVVLDELGFRRGSISLSVPSAFAERIWDSVGQEVLFAFRRQSPKAVQAAFNGYFRLSSLIASFNAEGIGATFDFIRVLLVAPYSGDQLGNLDRIQPQKGLERIAYYLLRNLPNVDVMVYNPNLGYSPEIFNRPEMKDFQILGFGTLDPVFEETLKIFNDFKVRYPQSLKIFGGIAASHMNPEKIFNSIPVDIIVRGPGEISMSGIIQNWQREGDSTLRFGNIPGLVLRDKEGIIITPPSRQLNSEEYLSAAYGDFEDVPLGEVSRLHERSYWGKMREDRASLPRLIYEIGRRSIRMGTADYCGRRCIFCSAVSMKKGKGGGIIRVELAPSEIVRLMKASLKRHPEADSFHFDDDDFITDRHRVMNLCELIIKSNLSGYPKLCKCRVDKIDAEILQIMKKAGFVVISYGVESFSDRILKQMRKGTNSKQNISALDLTLKAGIVPGINLILFNPFTTVNEVVSDIEKAIEYIKKGAYVFVNPIMEAYHGAPIMNKKDWINYRRIYQEGMTAPLEAPAYAGIRDVEASDLFEKAQLFKDEILKRWRSQFNLEFIPFFVSGLALFWGGYKSVGKSRREISEIENLVRGFLGKGEK